MSSDRIRMTGGRDPFGLAQLDSVAPPRDALPLVRAALARERRPRRAWLWPAAAAALLVASLGLIVTQSGQLEAQQEELDQWIAYSQRLEAEVGALRDRNSVLRGHEALAVSEIEDRVAAVDQRLASVAPEAPSLALWQERAALMNDLVTVHALANGRRWQPDARPVPVVTRNMPARTELTPASYRP